MKFKMKKWHRIAAGLLSAVLIAGALPAYQAKAADTTAAPFRILTADEIVEEMGTGINLGNTMDGHSNFTPNETVWQGSEGGPATQAFVQALHDMGFNTLRVPVTWGTMINEDCTINSAWISRVQDIVDYAIALDMYVVINIHHDGAGGWIQVDYDYADEVQALYDKFAAVWTNIADYFKDYDEHLVFESMNEVTIGGNNEKQCYELINNMNQAFVDAVRKTGSNNAERWLSVPGKLADPVSTMSENGLVLPTDSVENRIFVSVHYYDNNYGLSEDMNVTEWTQANSESLYTVFQGLYDTYTSKGVPVMVGEYGAVHKNNDENRAYHYEVVNAICKTIGAVPVIWDQGWYNNSRTPADYSFALVDRKTNEQVHPLVISGTLRGWFLTEKGKELMSAIDAVSTTTTVNKATAINVDADSVSLTAGEYKKLNFSVEPADTNDVVVWSSSDNNVATVYNGKVHAKNIGTCTLTAVSNSGSAKKEITVTVTADTSITAGTKITCEDNYQVDPGKYIDLNVTTDGGRLSYVSADPTIATVNTFGKVVGLNGGKTEITIQDTTGLTKTVTVSVEAVERTLNVSLCMYNVGEYFGEECGTPIVIEGNGKYEATICLDDLSAAAKSAGVSALDFFGALYLKDYDTLMGNKTASDVKKAEIRYDAIYVNGQKLTIDTETVNSAMNGTTFDTGLPVNAWTKSMVDEVNIDKSATQCSWTSVSDATTITLVFTLSGIEETLSVPDGYTKPAFTDFGDVSTEEPGSSEAPSNSATEPVVVTQTASNDIPVWGAVLISVIEIAAGAIAIVVILRKKKVNK